jgi:DtxR family Mn-dependent transcriptional regulator
MKKEKLTHSIEDYLEMIFLMSEVTNAIRITDIAAKMNVRKSSIHSAVKKMVESNFVEHERYGAITITEKGKTRAREVYHKHKILKSFFLEILGLPESIAETDACNIEHYISDQTVSALMELATKLAVKYKKVEILKEIFLL